MGSEAIDFFVNLERLHLFHMPSKITHLPDPCFCLWFGWSVCSCERCVKIFSYCRCYLYFSKFLYLLRYISRGCVLGEHMLLILILHGIRYSQSIVLLNKTECPFAPYEVLALNPGLEPLPMLTWLRRVSSIRYSPVFSPIPFIFMSLNVSLSESCH